MFDGDRLRAALAAIPAAAWSLPSTFAATGVHEGYRQVTVVSTGGLWQPVAESLGFVLDEYEPVWSAFLAWIEPGGYVLPHKDPGPYRERWHVPIECAGTTTGVAGEVGVPFTVEHWKWHDVHNPTSRRRVHLIIDRAVIVLDEKGPFTLKEHHDQDS